MLAFKEIIREEFGDKTFLLTFLFCLILQHDNKSESSGYNSNLSIALRIFISSSVGICVAMGYSVVKEEHIYMHQTNALVAVALLVTLIFYLHMICKSQLTSLALEEKADSLTQEFMQNKRNTYEIITKIKADQKSISNIKEMQTETVIAMNKGVATALEEVTQDQIIQLQAQINSIDRLQKTKEEARHL